MAKNESASAVVGSAPGPCAPVRAVIPPFELACSQSSNSNFLVPGMLRRFGGELLPSEENFEWGEPENVGRIDPPWEKHVLPKPLDLGGGDRDVVLGDAAGENQEQARALWSVALALEEMGDSVAAKKLKNKAQRLACCGRFGRIYRAVGCGRQGYRPFNCGLRTCQRCAPLLAGKLFDKFVVLENLVACRPGWTLALLDFTLKNTGSLPDAELVREANRAVRRTMKRLLRGIEGWGYLWIDELGFDNTNLHVHGIYYGPFLPQSKLSDAWREESGGSFIVWVQKVRRDFRAALWHHLKYVSKPPSNDPRRLAEIEAAFSVPRVVRKVHTLGAFYDLGDVTEAQVENAAGGRNCPCGCGVLVLASGYRPVSEFASTGIGSWDDIRREIALARVGTGPP